MAGGAVRRRSYSRRSVRCTATVTPATRQVFVSHVLERPANERLSGSTIRVVLADPAFVGHGDCGRCQRGARRHVDSERRSQKKLCDAGTGAPPQATSHGFGLVPLLHLHVRRRSQLWPHGKADLRGHSVVELDLLDAREQQRFNQERIVDRRAAFARQ